MDKKISPMQQIVGEQLGAVTFVQDYLQLHFDGPMLNVLNPLTVQTNLNSSRSWEPDFRNLLCEQITKIVRSVDIHDDYELLIVFEDDSSLSVSLKSSDYETPEAIHFRGTNQAWIIL